MPNGRTWLDPVLRPLERGTYRVMGVNPNKEHNWKQYTLAMLVFSLVGCVFTYAILRLQTSSAAQSAEVRRGESRSRLQHRGQFHHQHELAELRRRIHDVVFLADGRRWRFTISSRPRLASPSPLRWCAASRGIRRKPSAISGWISCASLTICCCRFAWSLRCSSCRRG